MGPKFKCNPLELLEPPPLLKFNVSFALCLFPETKTNLINFLSIMSLSVKLPHIIIRQTTRDTPKVRSPNSSERLQIASNTRGKSFLKKHSSKLNIGRASDQKNFVWSNLESYVLIGIMRCRSFRVTKPDRCNSTDPPKAFLIIRLTSKSLHIIDSRAATKH